MKFIILFAGLLSFAAMANSSSQDACAEFDAMTGPVSYNDAMDAYKYEVRTDGSVKECHKTYGSQECGCSDTAKPPSRD